MVVHLYVPLHYTKTTKEMTLTEKIKSEPYLKIRNCTDMADLNFALSRISDLQDQYPESKILRNMYFKFEYKRLKMKESL